jgi:aminoglycoside phosphotransferase (APT) family kinase protein
MMRDPLDGQLLDALRRQTGRSGLAYAAEPAPLRGGFWADLRAFSLVDPPPGWPADLVARVMPEPGLAAKETVIQAAIAAAGVPTPAVRAWGGPEDGLGRAYMVMDRASGAPLLAGLDRVGALIGAPGRLWRMPDVLAAVMARLHDVDPAVVRARLRELDGAATTVPDLLDHLDQWASRVGRPDLSRAARWLLDHPRRDQTEVVCHGDLHPFNVLIDAAGRVTLLDWSTAVLGPPAYDVAFTTLTLANPPVAVPPPLGAPVVWTGRRLAARFLRRYQHHRGVRLDPGDVTWHQAIVGLRALVEVGQWVHDGVVDTRAGHPWLLAGEVFARRVEATTGVRVLARGDGATGVAPAAPNDR